MFGLRWTGGLVLLMTALPAACTGAPDTTSPGPGDDPVITATVIDLEQSWDVAWSPSPDQLAQYEEALLAAGVSALIPTVEPAGESMLNADVVVLRTVPTGESSTSMVVRRSDRSVYVSLQAVPLGRRSSCASRLEDEPKSEWTAAAIRGQGGCSLLVVGAPSLLDWSEHDMQFLVEFGPDVELEALLSWLESWRLVASE